MHNLYPNFYSLTSASSKPLDTGKRRRSLMWNPIGHSSSIFSSGSNSNNSNHNNSIGCAPVALSQPVRRRSFSQIPSRSTINGDVPIQAPKREFFRESSRSLTPPPPPPPFADSTLEDRRSNSQSNGNNQTSVAVLEHQIQPTVVSKLPSSRSVGHQLSRPPNAASPHPIQPLQYSCVTPAGPAPVPIEHYPNIGLYSDTYQSTLNPTGSPYYQYENVSYTMQYAQSYPVRSRLQPAISLQCLHQIPHSVPDMGSVHPSTVCSKLVIGIPERADYAPKLGKSTLPVPFSSDLPPRPTVGRFAGGPAVIYSPIEPNYHQRIRSVPLDVVKNASSKCASPQPVHAVPVLRHSDGHRRARLTSRRRTLWGVPVPNITPIKYVQSGQAAPINLTPVEWFPGAREFVVVPTMSTADGYTDRAAVHSISSDSGVDLVEIDQVNSNKEHVASSTDESSQCSRTRRSVNSRKAHVVSVFEQSLSNMAKRLQMITHTARKKDSELQELRATLGALRSHTGLTSPGNNGIVDKQPSETELAPCVPKGDDEGNPQTTMMHYPHDNDCKSVGSGSVKKANWFRNSIGKAFRKKPLSTAYGSIPELTAGAVAESTQTCHRTEPSEPSTPQHDISPCAKQIEGVGSTSNLSQPSTLRVPTGSELSAKFDTSASITKTANPLSNHTLNVYECNANEHFGRSTESADTGRPAHSQNTATTHSKPNVLSICPFATRPAQSLNDPNEAGDRTPTTLSQPQLSSQLGNSVEQLPLAERQESVCHRETTTDANTPRMMVLQGELERLRSQLSEREMKLTDVQLEALASTHQVNQLRDQIARMNSELQQLRLDNERLHEIVNKKVDSVSTQIAHFAERPNTHPVFDRAARLSECQLLAGPGLDFASTNEAHGRILFVLRSTLPLDCSEKPSVFNLGLVRLDKHVDWVDLDQEVIEVYRNYINRLDPKNVLKLKNTGLIHYQLCAGESVIAERTILKIDQPKVTESLKNTLESIQDFRYCRIEVVLRPRPNELCFVDDISLHFMVPSDTLTMYLNYFEQYGCVVLDLSTDCTRHVDSLVWALATCLKRFRNVSRIIQFTGDDADELTNLERRVASTLGDFPSISGPNNQSALLLVRQLNHVTREEISQLLNRTGYGSSFLTSNNCSQPRLFILWTASIKDPITEQALSCSVPGLCRFIRPDNLTPDWTRELLIMRLRRRIINLTVKATLSTTPCEAAQLSLVQKLIFWLGETWERLNRWYGELLGSKSDAQAIVFDTTVFEDMPLQNTEAWFVNCWNTKIAPRFHCIQKHQTTPEVKDHDCLMMWIHSSWPWSSGKCLEELRLNLQPTSRSQ